MNTRAAASLEKITVITERKKGNEELAGKARRDTESICVWHRRAEANITETGEDDGALPLRHAPPYALHSALSLQGNRITEGESGFHKHTLTEQNNVF